MELVWISSPQSRKGSGVVALIIGLLLLLFSPQVSGLIGICIAAIILVLSLILLGFGVMIRGSGFSFLLIIFGIIGFLLGFSALLSPVLAIMVLGIFLGFWVFLIGCGQLALAFRYAMDRWYQMFIMFGGILTVLVGLYLILSPVEGMQIMVVFLGCYLIGYGILSLIRPAPVRSPSGPWM